MNQPPQISVVGPVYNERENLPTLCAELADALSASGPYEVVLVDDCSTDGSFDVMVDLASRDPRLRVLRLERRSGQSAALAVGLRAARGAVVVTLDTDLQNDPADIPVLLAALERFDLVCGVRQERQDGWKKRASSRLANAVRRLVLGDPLRDIGCGLKAMRAEYVRDLPMFDGLHRFLPVLAARRGARLGETSVRHRARRHGESKYGVADRAARGLFDLLGVLWLNRRQVDVAAVREVHAWRSERSGSSSASSARPASSPASSSSGSPPSGTRGASSPRPSGS
jgi:dolichol-phosphate mannosyltransferase